MSRATMLAVSDFSLEDDNGFSDKEVRRHSPANTRGVQSRGFCWMGCSGTPDSCHVDMAEGMEVSDTPQDRLKRWLGTENRPALHNPAG